MHCSACGAEAIEGAFYCHQCGQRLAAESGKMRQEPGRGDSPAPSPVEVFSQAATPGRLSPDPAEAELWSGRYSSKAMLGAWIICGLISITLLVAGVFGKSPSAIPQTTYWLILVAAMLLPWLYGLALLLYRRISVRYQLTSRRLIHESGILRRLNDRIEVIDMDDINFEQGLLERVVGVGTIRIAASDRSHPDLALPGIENVKQVAALFDDARLAERRRRSLHVEQV